MTETAPSHLDLDALADALAGEADAGSSAHLAQCSSCASRLSELEAAEAGVVAALQQLPDPPLLAGLAERLDAALRAEPPLTTSTSASSTVTPLPARTPRRWLPAAAAAVLLVSGGGLGYALVQGGLQDGSDTGSEAAGGLAAPPTSSTGIDYADSAAVSGALPVVLSGSAGGTTAGTLADSEMRTEAQDSAAAQPGPAIAAAPAEDPLTRLRTPDGLQECLAGVLPPEEPDVQPLALDYALYQGQPALAVVLPDPDPQKLSVYVVGPQCAQDDAQVLTFLRVDAP